MTARENATAAQWKTIASLSKKLGVRNASVLAGMALGRTEEDIRGAGLGRADATTVINAAIALQLEREKTA